MSHKSGKGARARRKLRLKQARKAAKQLRYQEAAQKRKGTSAATKQRHIPYRVRWGHEHSTKPITHPKREARKMRAYARGGTLPDVTK